MFHISRVDKALEKYSLRSPRYARK